jgi:DNA-binding response OmpR family regulator
MTTNLQQSEQKRILVVEDDRALSGQLNNFLSTAAFDVTVADCGKTAEALLKSDRFDLLLLDWKLPDCNGVDVCRRLREAGSVMPVIMLTGEAELHNKLEGYECGVDDYLTKPFEPRELLSRVKSLIARPPFTNTDEFHIGGLKLKIRTSEATIGGEKLNLLPKEYALLEFLARYPDQYFTAEDLLSRVWKADAEVGIATVRVQINNLRKKLGSASSLIQNSPGLGYRLVTQKLDIATDD